jgi:hypothetical protein
MLEEQNFIISARELVNEQRSKKRETSFTKGLNLQVAGFSYSSNIPYANAFLNQGLILEPPLSDPLL